jgi:hypothetical protein
MDGNNMPESTPNSNTRMNEHVTDNEIEAFRHSRLDGAELLRVSDHLAGCNLCRERTIPAGMLSVKIARLQEDFDRHLTDEELMSWVDAGPVDEPGLVEAHLEYCASCRQEVADLHAFQARLKPQARANLSLKLGAIAAALIAVVVLIGSLRQSVPHGSSVASAPPAPTVPAASAIERAPILDELYRPEGKLLGNATRAFRALSPVGIVTASDRPIFRWEAVPGPAEYVVSVYDTNFRKVTQSPKLRTNSWQPQEPLMRGVRLAWQVAVQTGDKTQLIPEPPAREAVFEVMNSESFVQIEHARDVEHASPAALGILYARAGALEDAETEFRKPPEADELLRSVLNLLQKQR